MSRKIELLMARQTPARPEPPQAVAVVQEVTLA
jgi:hypothetical protein